jgi:hypothetical protein
VARLVDSFEHVCFWSLEVLHIVRRIVVGCILHAACCIVHLAQDIEYVESIQADVKWMGFDYGEVTAGPIRRL